MESAPGSFRCSCGVPAVLYWLKDEVWALAGHAAPPSEQGGHLCLDCAGKAVGRPLTLHDLEIANYRRTPTPPGDPLLMPLLCQATVLGGYCVYRLPSPDGWPFPSGAAHMNAMKIGEQLARQTQGALEILPVLAAEVDRHFYFRQGRA